MTSENYAKFKLWCQQINSVNSTTPIFLLLLIGGGMGRDMGVGYGSGAELLNQRL